MNTTNRFFSAIVGFIGVLILLSCDIDDDIGDNYLQEVKFTSGATASATRVKADADGNSTWQQDDPIGVYMVENGTTTVAESATNRKYTAHLSGASTTFGAASTAIYYPVDATTKVGFIAYHPYNATVANYVYPINLQNQTPQTGIDLMWAKTDNSGMGYDKFNSSTVNFEFEHQLVKIVLNITKGAGVTGDLSAVKIKGMNTTANFDLKGTGGITTQANQQNITPCTVVSGSKYEAILLPVATITAAHLVEFTIGTDTYVWKMSDARPLVLEPGNLYIFNITLTKMKVNVSGSIRKWIDVQPIAGTAEYQVN